MEVSYGPIRLNLRRATVRDGYMREFLILRLTEIFSNGKPPPRHLQQGFVHFAGIVTQTVEASNLPFALITDESSDTELRDAFGAWWAMDEGFADTCVLALNDLRRPVDWATAPGKLPKDADPEVSSVASE